MQPLRTAALATITASALGSGALGLGGCEEPRVLALPEASSVSLEGLGADAPLTGTIDGEAFTSLDARFRVVRYEGRERVDLMFSDRAIERCGLPMDRPETLVWLRFAGEGALAPGTYRSQVDEARDEEGEGSRPEGEAAQRGLSVHWERPVGEGLEHVIRASDRGVGVVEIETATSEHVRGSVHVCFASEADGERSGDATRRGARSDPQERERGGVSDDRATAGSGGGEPPSRAEGANRNCVRGRFDARPCFSRIDGRTAREPPGLVDEALEPRASTRAPLRPTRRYEPAHPREAPTPTTPSTTPPPTTPAPTTPPATGAP
jgi:hypothetical protein